MKKLILILIAMLFFASAGYAQFYPTWRNPSSRSTPKNKAQEDLIRSQSEREQLRIRAESQRRRNEDSQQVMDNVNAIGFQYDHRR
jgi:hypothetical protein